MTNLRPAAAWIGVTLLSLVSAVGWFASAVIVMLWPLPAFAILTVSVVTSLAAIHIAQVRIDANRAAARAAAAARAKPSPAPPARPAQTLNPDDPLRRILGEDLYQELAALSSSPGTIPD